jgi:hypothetical protein
MSFCLHRDYSFPLRLAGEQSAHVTCRGCKRRIVYDWRAMRIVKTQSSRMGVAPFATSPVELRNAFTGKRGGSLDSTAPVVSRSVPGSPPEAAAPRAGAVSAAPAFLKERG